jgi:hypothetical protein
MFHNGSQMHVRPVRCRWLCLLAHGLFGIATTRLVGTSVVRLYVVREHKNPLDTQEVCAN